MNGSIIEGLEAQYEQSLANFNAIVAEEGGISADIAKITMFLTEELMERGFIGKPTENISRMAQLQFARGITSEARAADRFRLLLSPLRYS